jgi:hypothetical protein
MQQCRFTNFAVYFDQMEFLTQLGLAQATHDGGELS